MDNEEPQFEVKVDRQNLYKEDTFTDMKVAWIRRLTPVDVDGNVDLSRKVRFMGESQIMSPAGPLPVQFAIEGTTLDQAIERFPEALSAAVEEMISAAEELRRREMTGIVVPGREQTSRLKL